MSDLTPEELTAWLCDQGMGDDADDIYNGVLASLLAVALLRDFEMIRKPMQNDGGV